MVQKLNDSWVVSPQDVIAQFECGHKVALSAARKNGALDDFHRKENKELDLLKQQGLDHERRRLEQLDPKLRVKRLATDATHTVAAYEAAWEATKQAMDDEYDYIYQATLFTGDFIGMADFLKLARTNEGDVKRDGNGQAVYEPVDTKSARSAKTSAVIQLGSYAEALERLGRPRPERIHLWLAGDNDWDGPADPFMAVAGHYREVVQSRLQDLGHRPEPIWDAPREACTRCEFEPLCEEGRHQDKDLSLIQGINAMTRVRLIDSGLTTIDEVAAAEDENRPARVAQETFDRLRAQADIQVRGRGKTHPLFEIADETQFDLLPPRSAMDIWFDMEGDPYAPGQHGLEYMFGFGWLDGANKFEWDKCEGHNPEEEKRAFEDFVDEVLRRRDADPGMHVYHYANYEQRALKRLAQQYGTREGEIDRLLKEGRLVDLYKIVQRALRFSTESLSLKYIEAVYGVSHSDEAVATAMDSVIQYEAYVALMEEGKEDEAERILEEIREYNKKDCESTWKLDDWLRRRYEASPEVAGAQGSIDDTDDADVTDPHSELIGVLVADLPSDPDERSEPQQARALLASALQYHNRERRPAKWEFYEQVKAEPEELYRASDIFVVSNSEQIDEWKQEGEKIQRVIRLFSENEDPRLMLESVSSGRLVYDPAPEGAITLTDSLRGYSVAKKFTALSETSVTITEEITGSEGWSDAPIAVLPVKYVDTESLERAIATAAESVLPERNEGHWNFPDKAWADLLLAREPRTKSASLPDTGSRIDDICAALKGSLSSYIAVQGPPGTGKTFVGSRAVARLAQEGWRIGVVAQSHAVVDNFLGEVHKIDETVELRKRPDGKNKFPWHTGGKNSALKKWVEKRSGGCVIGGTAWTFSDENIRNLRLDLLVIDEAGQFALANTIACSLAAQRVLLLGDPQQLPQVSQAAHPEGMERSVLEHVIGDHKTIPPERGYFLDLSHRMHPELTKAVSHLQYEDRLESAPVAGLRSLEEIPPGVIPVPVDHRGNTTSCPEEAHEVVAIIESVRGREWIDAIEDERQPPRRIGLSDILVVAAFNDQVRLIKRQLEQAGLGGVEVGTVDKFQGKEAPVVIVSMATSSAEDLPRGLDFLLSPNRLNVAISRAQWASYVLYAPELLNAQPSSIEGLRRLGQFLDLMTDNQKDAVLA